jgi:hypothetical protein
MKYLTKHSPALLLTAAVCAAPALALAQVNYGDFSGSTVTYLQVTETALSPGDTEPLFGAPTISGNTLDFNPVNFVASASGAGGTDQTDGKLDFGISAVPGNFIPEVELSEAGDFTLGGFANDAFASVTATLFIDIYEVDGAPISTVNDTYSMTFTPSNGDWQLTSVIDNPGGSPSIGGIWSGSVSVDIEQLMIDKSVSFVNGATKVGVVLDNTLLALSQDGTTAEIRKKDFKGFSITVVPEPTSFALALLGLGGLGATAFRKRNNH